MRTNNTLSCLRSPCTVECNLLQTMPLVRNQCQKIIIMEIWVVVEKRKPIDTVFSFLFFWWKEGLRLWCAQQEVEARDSSRKDKKWWSEEGGLFSSTWQRLYQTLVPGFINGITGRVSYTHSYLWHSLCSWSQTTMQTQNLLTAQVTTMACWESLCQPLIPSTRKRTRSLTWVYLAREIQWCLSTEGVKHSVPLSWARSMPRQTALTHHKFKIRKDTDHTATQYQWHLGGGQSQSSEYGL